MRTNLLLLTLVCGLTLPTFSQGVFADEDQEDVAVAIDGLPAGVMSAVTRVFPNGTIQQAEKDSEDQSVLFDVKVRSEETLYSVEVTPEGKLIQVEVDDEDQVGLADDESDDGSNDDGEDGDNEDSNSGTVQASLPAAAQAAVAAAFPNGRIEEVDSQSEDGRVVYDVDLSVDDKTHEMEVTADGHVLKIQKGDD